MRIVIDMQGAQTGSRYRGIGRYTLAIVKAMLTAGRDHEFYIVLNGMFPETIPEIREQLGNLIEPEKIRVWFSEAPVAMHDPENLGRVFLAEYIREAFINALEPDFLIITSLCEGLGDDFVCSIKKHFQIPTAVILYDLIPMVSPEIYLSSPQISTWYFGKISELMKADMLLAISIASGEDAVSYLDFDRKNVIPIWGSSDETFKKQKFSKRSISNTFAKFNIARPYLMYTSATDERKNHRGLISAYAKLDPEIRSSFCLLFVGGLPSEHQNMFEQHAIDSGLSSDELIITGHLSDIELNLLYNNCHSFVFPSWHEGLGLPILEAMRCGKAVIASNCSSIPEVIGLDEALFDPHDADDIARKIRQVLTDASFRSRLEKHSKLRVKQFTWLRSAEAALTAIEARARPKKHICNVDPEVLIRTRMKSVVDHAQYHCSSLARQANVAPVRLALHLSSSFGASNRQRQLLFDVSQLVNTDAKTGIQRVVRAVLSHCLQNPPHGWQVEPVYATIDEDGYRYARRFTCRFLGIPEDWAVDEPVEAFQGDVFLGLDLQPNVVPRQVDVLHEWHRRGVGVHFVVYDLVPVLMPDVFPDGAKTGHHRWLEAVTQFDSAICISRAVADELEAWLKAYGPKRERLFALHWFHLGGDTQSSVPTRGMPANAQGVLDILAERPTFLCVGTLEPRKGQGQLLSAFEELWAEGRDINLVLVGKQGWMVEDLVERARSHPELGKRLFWLAGISDEYLDEIYAASSCLIAASESEGFGLPLIEAAQHKRPIIARDIPVFREVAGDHAFYFPDTKEPKPLAQAVEDWMALDRNGRTPVSGAMLWQTWAQSADRLLDCIFGRSPPYKRWRPEEPQNRNNMIET